MGDMTAQVIAFAALALIFAAMLVIVAIRAYRRSHRTSEASWDELLGRLVAVNHGSIAEVALDLVDESGVHRNDASSAVLEPEEIWEKVGGMDGLEILERNCSVLIDLACYVQRWYPEAVVVAEQLRLSAREIEFHIGRLRAARATGKLEVVFSMYAPRAVATYYFMTRKLLSLYEKGNMEMLSALEKAI
jgi:hypothetical protein